MGSVLQDARFGIRILLRAPVIAISIILVLALGIGANSAMFGVVDGLLLHPVHYPNPETLAFIWNHDPQGALSDASAADFMDWRAQSKSFSDLAAWMPTSFVMTDGDHPRQTGGARVTANFFRALGVKAVLGRTFLPDEDGLEHPADAARSVVISYRLWQEDLGADPNVLGRTLRIDSTPYAIVGVAPAGFQFWWRPHDLWVPVTLNVHERDYHDLVVVARLSVTRARAAAEMAVIARSLGEAYPKSDKGWTIQIEDFRDYLLSRTFRARLLLLTSAVGLVLLIACTNVAGLLLARSAAREREVAVRASLGASQSRLVRQLLTEAVLLALAGGTLGLAIAWGLIRVAPKIVPPTAIPGGSLELSVPVIWFALVISLLTSLVFGLAPALAGARTGLQAVLKRSSRGSTGGVQRRRFRQYMVAAEVALALIMLASAWLMIGSFRDLTKVDLGFDPENLLTLRMILPPAKFDASQTVRFCGRALERISSLPGVKSAANGSSLPLLDNMEVSFDHEGSPRGDAERPRSSYASVSSEYFRTLRIPAKRGRLFTKADDEKAPTVAIVSEALAARYFPNEDPVGKRIVVKRPIRAQNGEETVKLEIVGVVGNVKLADLSPDPKPLIYAPYPQNPWSRSVWFAARTDVNPSGLTSAIRGEFMAIDRDWPIEQVGTLKQMLNNQFAQPRFQTALMSSFALMALLLAAVGIYGVNAYAVEQRRNEIGLRMALGASRMDVVRDILGQGMRPTAIGIALGVAGADAVAFWLRSVLVGTGTLDPLAFLGAALLLAIVAAAACYFPARRATRIDPAIALKAD